MRLLYLCIGLCLVLPSCQEGSPIGSPDDSGIGLTARDRYDEVQAIAKARDNTVKLVSISTDNMDGSGRSETWSFVYSTTVPPVTWYYFTASHDTVACDSISTRGGAVGAAFITHKWMNSSEAAQIAENAGGRAFRSANSGCTARASLGEPVIPNPRTFWYIIYRSKDNASAYWTMNIDATGGSDP